MNTERITTALYRACAVLFAIMATPGCQPGGNDAEPVPPAPVTDARLLDADADTANWLMHGRTYSEQRFSPLHQIDHQNVGNLELAWFYDLDYDRGIEATPLVVDGILYTTGSWSVVYALDAANGRLLWKYDPKVPRSWGPNACCDVVNRGVAAWGDKIYVGTLDGYLVALDGATGEVAWRVLTIDPSRPYTITGAPRAIRGRIVIGNGGAELGVRGYITAYDAETGSLAWRFHTVPGNPEEPFESQAMEMAAATWKGGEWWKVGGGGTVWDSMAYDPELDLLYIGVGNGAPWVRELRSPGGGDNLFLSSIVALRPETGEYVWHYQTTPGDSWDYTATQHMILADIEIDGEPRKVLMQAPKNGFFYVIDRTDGTLISANNYVPVNWASHIDLDSGRPVFSDDAYYGEAPRFTVPGPAGGHNWHPMAYSPITGLVYIPAQEMPFAFGVDPDFEYRPGRWNLGIAMLNVASPEDPEVLEPLLGLLKGRILAWDPVEQRAGWAVEHTAPWNGGLLATAGNLIFQGQPSGEFAAYRADNGEKVWSFDTQTGAVAAPISYMVGDEQYVSITVGWGTALATLGGEAVRRLKVPNLSRALGFKLGGEAHLPPVQPTSQPLPVPPDIDVDDELVARGKRLYYGIGNCIICHGDGAVSGGLMPDLRYSTPAVHERWGAIVLGGERAALGMPGYAELLSESDARALQAYVINRSGALRRQITVQQPTEGSN